MAFLVKLLVSTAIVAWLVHGLDFDTLATTLARVDTAAMLLATLVVLALASVQAQRWRWVLRALGGGLGFPATLGNVLVGQFFNQTLPSTIGGDAMRVWLLREDGMRFGLAMHSVLIDRLAALGALVLLGLAGLPWLAGMDAGGAATLTVGSAGALALAALTAVLLLDHLPGRLLRWRPFQALAGLSADARRVMGRPRVGGAVITASLFIHGVLALVVYIIALALHMEVSAWHCMVLVPPVMVASAVPVSVAGWGVREGAMVAAFSLVGVSDESAFALSVLFGLTIVVAGLPGGLLWMLRRGQRPRRSDQGPARG